ncbi:MAG: T9SS type A sorting domain-containing protein [Flavobacterium sp.]
MKKITLILVMTFCCSLFQLNAKDALDDNSDVVYTTIRPADCGTTISNFRQRIRAIVPPASSLSQGSAVTGYRFRIFNMTRGGYFEIEKSVSFFDLMETGYGRYNTVYNIEVAVRIDDEWMPFGNGCVISTVEAPLPPQLLTQHCGSEILSANSIIRCNPVHLAETYIFKVEFLDDDLVTHVGFYESEVANFRMSFVQNIPSFSFDQEYLISVLVTYPTSFNTLETSFGASCLVATRSTPFPRLEGCDGEVGLVLESGDQPFYVSPVAGANRYRIELTYSNNQSQTITKTTNEFSLLDFNLPPENSFGDIVYARVWVRVSGSTLFYEGKDCSISFPDADRPAVEYFPNPFNHSLTVYWEEDVTPLQLRVFNSIGTCVEHHNTSKISGNFLKIGNSITSGIYIVRVEFDQDTQVFRVVKN